MDHLKMWLTHEYAPSTFYELLAMPCLSTERDELQSRIRTATRFLHQYQHHKDKRLVERARHLQLMCARAAYTFSNDDAWKAYDDEVLARIREQCLTAFPPARYHRRLADVRIWLRDVQRVADQRIDEVIARVGPKEEAVQTEASPSPVAVPVKIIAAAAKKPVPPPLPVRPASQDAALVGSTDSVNDLQDRLQQVADADRRIWQLTGVFLMLALLGAVWLLLNDPSHPLETFMKQPAATEQGTVEAPQDLSGK